MTRWIKSDLSYEASARKKDGLYHYEVELNHEAARWEAFQTGPQDRRRMLIHSAMTLAEAQAVCELRGNN